MSLFPPLKPRMIFILYSPILLSNKEVYVKEVIRIASALVLISCTYVAKASSELCIANNNDCTFVLLSNAPSKTVSETTTKTEGSQNSAHVTQGSQITKESEMLLLVNEKRARQRLSPFSTFKIPNSLIALEIKLIVTAQQKLLFDKDKYQTQA